MVKTKHGTFEVRSITFGERRELHRLEMKAYRDESLDLDGYFLLLDWITKKAFTNPEESLKDLDDAQIDEVLNDIYVHYKGLSKKNNSK